MNAIQRIILIDDNEMDNVYHQIIIKRAGFGGELLTFEAATDALAYLGRADLGVPSLIFLDINMPGMDGFEFAEQATVLLIDKPATTIMMLTSSSAERDRIRASSIAIIKGFLTKPLTETAVNDLLDRHCR